MDNNYNGSYAELVTDIAENVELVFEAGQKSEYDRFWDAFQDYGKRTNYSYAFGAWTDEIFKPKYDIVCKGWSSGIFHSSFITDLKGLLEKQGVKLDTSENQSLLQSFQQCKITHIPEINATISTNNNYLFSTNTILTIDKFIVSETTSFTSTTFSCSNLESVIFEGVIGQNGLRVSSCTKLSHESLMSIKRALKSGVSGLTVTFSTKHKEDGKLTDSDIAEISAKGWSVAFQ